KPPSSTAVGTTSAAQSRTSPTVRSPPTQTTARSCLACGDGPGRGCCMAPMLPHAGVPGAASLVPGPASHRGAGVPGGGYFFAAVLFFVVVLRVVVRRVVVFFVGPLARFSASSSKARSGVIVSTASSLRRVALVVPSVT